MQLSASLTSASAHSLTVQMFSVFKNSAATKAAEAKEESADPSRLRCNGAFCKHNQGPGGYTLVPADDVDKFSNGKAKKVCRKGSAKETEYRQTNFQMKSKAKREEIKKTVMEYQKEYQKANSEATKEYQKEYREARSAEERAYVEQWLSEHGTTGIHSGAERGAIFDTLLSDKLKSDDWRINGKTVEQLFDTKGFSGYIGMTGRSIEQECVGFLSERGSLLHTGGRTIPVIQFSEDYAAEHCGGRTIIKASDARDIFHFDVVPIYENEVEVNCSWMEAGLQRQIHHLGLPTRLHRVIGAGANGYGKDAIEAYKEHKKRKRSESGGGGSSAAAAASSSGSAATAAASGGADKIYKVFLTYSFDVKAAIAEGKVNIMV